MYGADKTDRAAMSEIYAGGARVTCRLCKSPQGLAGTQLCDRCWELDMRIRADPQLAQEVLNHIKAGQKRKVKIVPWDNKNTWQVRDFETNAMLGYTPTAPDALRFCMENNWEIVEEPEKTRVKIQQGIHDGKDVWSVIRVANNSLVERYGYRQAAEKICQVEGWEVVE